MKIDLEKLICSLMSDDSNFINGFYKNLLKKVLKEQGIEYKDSKLVQIENQQEFDKINTSNHLCHHSEESADHQEKVFVYHTPQTSLPLSKEVHYMLVDKDLSSLLKQLCKEASSLQGHELHSYLSYLAGVFEGSARQRQQKIEQKPAWSEMGANGNDREIPLSEQKQDVSMQINPSEYINDMGGNRFYLKNTAQASAWSEEDEPLCMQIEGLLKVCQVKNLLSFDLYKKMCDWLKALKDRVQPQKQEWSEQDERIIQKSFMEKKNPLPLRKYVR